MAIFLVVVVQRTGTIPKCDVRSLPLHGSSFRTPSMNLRYDINTRVTERYKDRTYLSFVCLSTWQHWTHKNDPNRPCQVDKSDRTNKSQSMLVDEPKERSQ